MVSKATFQQLNFSDILTLYSRAVRRQEKTINYSLHNPETRVQVLRFIEETQSSENMLDVGIPVIFVMLTHWVARDHSPGWPRSPHLLSGNDACVAPLHRACEAGLRKRT